MNYLQKRKMALGYAFGGLFASIRRESHMKLHLLSAVIVIALSAFFSISGIEWIAVITCISLVFIMEIINTAIEKICDLVTPELHPVVKYIKDIAAASVLVACLMALVTGLIVFVPYFRDSL